MDGFDNNDGNLSFISELDFPSVDSNLDICWSDFFDKSYNNLNSFITESPKNFCDNFSSCKDLDPPSDLEFPDFTTNIKSPFSLADKLEKNLFDVLSDPKFDKTETESSVSSLSSTQIPLLGSSSNFSLDDDFIKNTPHDVKSEIAFDKVQSNSNKKVEYDFLSNISLKKDHNLLLSSPNHNELDLIKTVSIIYLLYRYN